MRLLPVTGLLAVVACAREPLPEAPVAVELTGVRVQAAAWAASAEAATTDGRTVQASGVRADVGGAPPIDVRAKATEWDLQARTARFTGEVRVTRGDVTLTCDRVEVRYGADDRIDHLAAEGRIRVEQGARLATAEKAEVEGRTGRIVLTGSPVLAEGPNRLEGATITLYLDDKRVTCASADGGTCHLAIDGSALPSVAP